MPELDESQITFDNSDTDPNTEQENELLANLPDDPAERAKELETRFLAKVGETERLTRESERLASRVTEERGRGDHWFAEAEKRKTAPSATPGNNGSSKTKLPPVDLAEFVGDEEKGYEKLAERLMTDLNLVSRDDLEQERIAERTANQRSSAIQSQLAQEYPQLEEPKSPLRKEAVAQFVEIEKEHPDWATEAISELAVARAARKLGLGGKQPDGNDRANRAFGPDGRRGTGQRGRVVVDDKLRKLATQTAGEPLSEEVLARVAKTVQQNQVEASRMRR